MRVFICLHSLARNEPGSWNAILTAHKINMRYTVPMDRHKFKIE